MHHIKSNRFCLPETGQMEFTVNCIESTTLNQSEPHIHRDCEIYVNLAGDVSFEVEGRIYPVSRGTVIITRPYEYHRCILHTNALHSHIWITFSPSRNEVFLKSFFDREKGHNNRILLPEPLLETFCRTARSLTQSNTDTLQRQIYVLQLFQILQQGNRADSADTFEKLPSDVIAALLYMDEHLTEDFDMQILAQKSGVSIRTMERHFRQALGALPMDTLRRKRLFVSIGHLRNGETVANAAIKSGFSDYSAFIQLFKKHFGITPLKYKKEYQKQ